MCGRFALFTPIEKIISTSQYECSISYIANYNITPSMHIPALYQQPKGNIRVDLFQWGLIPAWAKQQKFKPINARCETITEKPFFRQSFQQRRCLIFADGYFEWRTTASGKQPYYLYTSNQKPFAMAGIWDLKKENDDITQSCAIITTQANTLTQSIHERMPVIIDENQYERWLTSSSTAQLEPLFKPHSANNMKLHPVSSMVNTPQNNQVSLIKPLSEISLLE